MKMYLIRKWGIEIKGCLKSSFIFCQDVVLSVIWMFLKGLYIYFRHEGCDECDVQKRLFSDNFVKG